MEQPSPFLLRLIARPGLAWLMALSTASVSAAGETPDWSDGLAHNRPWQALEALRQSPANAQITAQVAVFVGDEQPSCALRPSRAPEPLSDAAYRDALEVIADAVTDVRVVMLNESHFRRAHRVFLGGLVEELHSLGFDALAAETFGQTAPASLEDGVPDAATGFYTADPAFAAALRRAHALGWEFVPYEPTDADREAREIGQAEALATWIEANPGRRLLVHAGGSHISENPEEGWMAARFAARTSIDPLTIAQGATACPDGPGDWPLDAESPVVAVRGGVPLGANHADIVVFHPPAAVAAAEAGRGAQVSLCVAPRTEDTLLRAFADGEDDSAIAWDQAIVPAGAAAGVLRLPPGRYRIAREDTDALETLGRVVVAPDVDAGCLRIQSTP